MQKTVFPKVEGDALGGVESLDLDKIYRSAAFEGEVTQRDFYFGKREGFRRDRNAPLKIREPSPLVDGKISRCVAGGGTVFCPYHHRLYLIFY